MTEIVMEAHRRKIPIDHPDRSVTREKLEYPTEDVTLAYLACIDKMEPHAPAWSSLQCRVGIVTVDHFTDKACECYLCDRSAITGRYTDNNNQYINWYNAGLSTQDHALYKITGGTVTKLAYESVDLPAGAILFKLSISGSTIKSFRVDMDTPKLTVTDTDHAIGSYGVWVDIGEGYQYSPDFFKAYLRPPSTTSPRPHSIVECEIVDSEDGEKARLPNMLSEIVEISKISESIPSFLRKEAYKYYTLRNKGFTDDEINALLGYIPQHQVDLASVTCSFFEDKINHNTAIFTIYSDNFIKKGAIQKQIAYAKAKGLKVLKPPKDYREAIEQYNQLKKDFPHWVAGKDNWAYQTLGHEIFDLFQVADTYHGNIVEGYKPDAYKKVPDWEMRKTLSMWKERLNKVSALAEERDKHLKKLEKVEKVGW